VCVCIQHTLVDSHVCVSCVCLVCVYSTLWWTHTGKMPMTFHLALFSCLLTGLTFTRLSLFPPPLSPPPSPPVPQNHLCVCVGGGLWRPLVQTLRPSVRHLFSLTHARGGGVVEQASFRWCTTPASKRSSLPLMLVLFPFYILHSMCECACACVKIKNKISSLPWMLVLLPS
jgi:hypothetical protein